MTIVKMELELEDQEDRSKCSKCLEKFRKVLTFLLSHIGLISLVVGYCIMGAFTFEGTLSLRPSSTIPKFAIFQNLIFLKFNF